ncbi:MAG: nodulation protein NfeD [Desulfobacterales bacterium]|nr:nodulation protein NfeD [Desulfobacterales bacterium]
MKTKLILFLAVIFFLILPAYTFAAGNDIYTLEATGAISPGTADYIVQGLEKASEDKAACIIIKLDTPGGLSESMRTIVMAMFECDVPVIVYVTPGGARAASAGVMITMAADIAAMAPGTNIGAAHPVGMGGKDVEETMAKKVTNDMVAFARSVAEKKGKNADWAEQAVRESVSVTETEALKNNIIDLVAKDMDDLVKQINGREINDKGKLELNNPDYKNLKENFRTKILKIISDPNIAYILMMIGLAGLYFELSHPGAIFPGVVGAIAIVLAFFAFQTLPVNYAGFLLILLAMIFFIMEMKIMSYGLLSVAGIVSLALGSIMLFESPDPAMKISLTVFVPSLVLISGFFIFIAGLVFKAQTAKPYTGEAGLIGETGTVKKTLAPEGKVFVHGELWHAVSKTHIEEGKHIRVVKVNGLVLEVEEIIN